MNGNESKVKISGFLNALSASPLLLNHPSFAILVDATQKNSFSSIDASTLRLRVSCNCCCCCWILDDPPGQGVPSPTPGVRQQWVRCLVASSLLLLADAVLLPRCCAFGPSQLQPGYFQPTPLLHIYASDSGSFLPGGPVCCRRNSGTLLPTFRIAPLLAQDVAVVARAMVVL